MSGLAACADIVEDFFEEPHAAAAGVRRRRPVLLGCACYLLAGLSLFVTQGVLGKYLFLSSGAISLMLIFMWQLAAGAVLAGVLHLAAEASLPDASEPPGGAAMALFTLLGLSELAWVPMLPAAVLLKAAGLGGWASLTMLICVFGLAVLVLKARSLREVYGLSGVASWAVLLSPFLAAAVLSMAAGLLAFAGVILSVVRLAQ